MNETVILRNVMDTRTGKIHSIVKVNVKKAHWFVPVEPVEEEAE